MKRIISIALGNFWRWERNVKNRNELIKYSRKLGLNGLEITIATTDELFQTKFSVASLKWLRSLKYISIHAPFRLLERTENQAELIRCLDQLQKCYQQTRAKCLIIHPHQLPKLQLLKRYKFQVSTENMTPEKRIGITQLKKVFRRYPQIKLCLDVSHAYLWSPQETAKLVKAFKPKISQIHLSGTYRRRDHCSLRTVTKNFLASIEPIKKLNVPIVIEEDLPTPNINDAKKEIQYIKSLLK